MRIAIAVRRLSRRGGLESNSHALARHLVARGHQVLALCQRVEDPIDGVEVHALPVLRVFGEAAKILSFSRLVADALGRLRPELSFSAAHVDCVDVVRVEGGLVDEHRRAVGRLGPSTAWRLRLDPAERAAEHLERRRLRRARRILTLSDASRRRLLERGVEPERVRVLRNGVDLERFRPAAPELRETERARLGLRGFTLAFVSTNHRRKGLEPLLRALALRGDDTELLVVGEDRGGPAFARLARTLGVRLQLLGRCPDVGPILAAADALALPSLYEAYGLVALEALACGRPVVLSREAGASEIVPHPELVLDDPLDVPALADTLGRARTIAAQPDTAGLCRAAAERWPIEASFVELERQLLELAP
jgi:UDP-glucose:(heptosyl)LPS alpha-1,3-glucosyltransferase